MKKRLLVGLLAAFMTLGLFSCGSDGKTPYIGDNGNWWIGETDLGVSASGENGKDGKSVTVTSVKKTSSEGLVDTYEITFSDGTSTTFTVTNGESNVIENIELTDSTGLVDTYTITFTNGSTKTFTVTKGKDGSNLTITSIELKSSEGLIDTYVINYSDGSKFEFVVSNGADGLTPYIGDNGNWWIGETDTGVLADWEKANNVPLTVYSNGLTYVTKTIDNKTGYVVTGWNDEYLEETYYFDLIAKGKSLEEAKQIVNVLINETENGHIVIPNYIGSVPVIGIGASSNLNFRKITLSRNTVWLGEQVFYNCNNLKEVDFNNANIKQIPTYGFANTSVGNIELPSSVTIFKDYAFSGVKMTYFNVSNAKYIGRNAFDSLSSNYVYLPETITYVGDAAFRSSRVYIEQETYPSTWASTIVTGNEINGRVSTGCKSNGEYIYSFDGDEVTIYQYLGTDKKISIPSMIDEKRVTKIGYGFATRTSFTTVEITDYEEINDYIALEEVVLPEGIKSIGDFALCGFGLTVFAPNSLEEISETYVSAMRNDSYNQINLNGTKIFAINNYLALAGNEMPTVVDGISHKVVSDWTKEKIESGVYRIGFGIDKSKVEEDSNFYYINDGESYSVMSYKGLKGITLTIPSTFNEKPVLNILSKAIGFDSTLEVIKIENGIVRIKPFGIYSYKINIITIPLSMLVINANGIYCDSYNTSIYVAASSKPVDWDYNWTNRLENVIFGINGEIESNNFFVYFVIGNQITLISYIGKSSNIYIPSKIDEVPVTSIKTSFYKRNGHATIYIPSSISTIESKAFVNSSSNKFEIYLEAEEKPTGWDDNWYYSSNFTNDNTSYVTKSWNQTERFDYLFNDDYFYSVNGEEVTLLSYHGNSLFVNIPRKIDGKNVTTIKGYCFYFDKSATINIPKEVIKIYMSGIELYGTLPSIELTVNCEATSRPSGWNTYFAYNSYKGSTSYINTNYKQTLSY